MVEKVLEIKGLQEGQARTEAKDTRQCEQHMSTMVCFRKTFFFSNGLLLENFLLVPILLSLHICPYYIALMKLHEIL